MSPQKLIAKIKAFIQEDKQRAAIVGGIILLSLVVIFIFVNEGKRRSAENEANLTPTVSPTEEPEPTEEPDEETEEEEEEEIEPTIKPKATATPTSKPAATNTPGPTATNTPAVRTANPPKMRITFPSEGQTIEFTSSSQTFCVADAPDGGDTSGLQRKKNINNGGWTNYENISTLCYEPKEGSNTLGLQYRNSYGEESGIYHINFTFKRVSPTNTPTPTITPSPAP